MGYIDENAIKGKNIRRRSKSTRNTVPSRSIVMKCIEAGISPTTYYNRLRRGMTEKQALAVPKYTRIEKPIYVQCKEAGVKTTTYYKRRQRGLSHFEALHYERGCKSITSRCREAGISKATYYNRLRKGLPEEMLFAEPKRKKRNVV